MKFHKNTDILTMNWSGEEIKQKLKKIGQWNLNCKQIHMENMTKNQHEDFMEPMNECS